MRNQEIAERLREVREALEMNQEEMAKVAATPYGTYQRYEQGASPPKLKCIQSLAAYGVSADWLLTGDGDMLARPRSLGAALNQESTHLGRRMLIQQQEGVIADAKDALLPNTVARELDDGFVLVPRYDIEASVGPGTFASEERVVDHLAFKADFIRRVLHADPRHLVLISAVGDSMEPGIRSGDLLLVDTGCAQFLDDAIYVVALGGILMVKRVQRFFTGAVTVKSDNPSYVEQTLSPDEVEEVHVAGRVRWIGRLI